MCLAPGCVGRWVRVSGVEWRSEGCEESEAQEKRN